LPASPLVENYDFLGYDAVQFGRKAPMFPETCCLHLQGQQNHIPEYHNFHIHCHQKIKFSSVDYITSYFLHKEGIMNAIMKASIIKI
jgi:hypothetical protein